MPKGEGVTLEELKFVWRLIPKDYSDKAILNEYDRLARCGKLAFPLRTDIRFVRRRRAEYQAAKEILQPYLEGQVDPVLAERKREHWDSLVEEAKKLRQELYSAIASRRLVELEPGGRVLSSGEGAAWFFHEVGGKPKIRLTVEDDKPFSLFRGLLEHLDAEFLEFSKRLERWRVEAGKLIVDWHHFSNEISGKVKKIEDKHPEVEVGAGCSAAIYRWVLEHFGKEGQYPVVVKRVHGIGESRADLLVENEQGMWELASVPVEKTKQWERTLHSLIDFYIKDPGAAELTSTADRLKEIADPLRNNLALVINRRTFRGTCLICCDMGVG